MFPKWYRRALWLLTLCIAGAMAAAQTASSKSETRPNLLAAADPTADVAPVRVADAKTQDEGYVIGPDDVLAINVWKEAEVSRVVPVRSDGKISLPLAGEIQAGGETPKQLEREIASKLKSYIEEPEVTVIVQEIKSQRINILGQVARPGSYLLTNNMTALDAIAAAGGFRDFAKQKSIYILRQMPDGSQKRLPFNYKAVIQGQNPQQNVKLEPKDTIVIP